jgi:Sulfotransferase domain
MSATVYIVSGLPRSGTSMMMQMLHRGGLPVLTDAVRSADEDNPRGYFELERVKQTKGDPSWLADADGKVVKLISRLLLDLPDPDPERVRYKVIFMRRDLDEVLRSQKKMLDRRGEDDVQTDEQVKELFVAHLEEIENWLRKRGDIDVIFQSYSRMVAEPRQGAEKINQFLGGILDVEAMLSEVDPELYRNRKK